MGPRASTWAWRNRQRSRCDQRKARLEEGEKRVAEGAEERAKLWMASASYPTCVPATAGEAGTRRDRGKEEGEGRRIGAAGALTERHATMTAPALTPASVLSCL
eukprot:scaffold9106_cov29-Tisochrysis_lutea.AAC.2